MATGIGNQVHYQEQYGQKMYFPILTIINCSPSSDDNIQIRIPSTGVNDSANSVYHHRNLSTRKCEYKIVILGDSHTCSCAMQLKYKLTDNFEVMGFIKPGRNIESLTSTINSDVSNLSKNDVLIFWGGTNNVSKNNSTNGLKNITQFVRNNNHFNNCISSL
jgi:hypothetical protein